MSALSEAVQNGRAGLIFVIKINLMNPDGVDAFCSGRLTGGVPRPQSFVEDCCKKKTAHDKRLNCRDELLHEDASCKV